MANEELKVLNILDKILDKKYWSYYYLARKHYTGHTWYNSPYESDDNCGTCDGARCGTCREIIEELDIECSIQSNILENMLIEAGAPKDVAEYFAYDDSCRTVYNGYKFVFPKASQLKSSYHEKYN